MFQVQVNSHPVTGVWLRSILDAEAQARDLIADGSHGEVSILWVPA